MNLIEELAYGLSYDQFSAVKEEVLNILFSKSELLLHLFEHPGDAKHVKIHELVISTSEYYGFSLTNGRDPFLSMVYLNETKKIFL